MMNCRHDGASIDRLFPPPRRLDALRMRFDAIAPHYGWLERATAGSLLQRCRTAFLAELAGAQRILLLGEGRGRFLFELLKSNPNARVTCLDASARMLGITRAELLRRASANCAPSDSSPVGRLDGRDEGRHLACVETHLGDRVRFVHADILDDTWDWQATTYDAVASHFFLDCFPPDRLQTIISKVASITAPGGQWLLSDFCVPERGWRRFRAQVILLGLYAFFRVFTRLPAKRLTAPDRCLQMAGFQLRRRQHFNHGLLHSDLWEKL